MIDVLKSYNQLRAAPGYKSSVRYYIAKRKLDVLITIAQTLFLKWLSTNKDIVQGLLKKAVAGTLKASEQPNPLFTHHRVPLQNAGHLSGSTLGFNNTITPPRRANELANTNSILTASMNLNMPKPSSLTMTLPNTKQDLMTEIPQFYFQHGKPVDKITEQACKSQLNALFADKSSVSIDTVRTIVVDVLGLPSYFSVLVMFRCTGSIETKTLARPDFNRVWKELENKEVQRRAYWLLSSQGNKRWITIDDFKRLLKEILNVHPGLSLLQNEPQFQELYALCVIHRMYFMANRKYDYRMTYRQFKNSRILKSIFDAEADPSINNNCDFFSYEDFYMIYMKFFELDSDHDFLLTQEELSKYAGYTLSKKVVQRIFSESVKKFIQPQKMGFGDFVWFILAVEDKTTEQSIEYWFHIMDLDNNGVITGYELKTFYDDQSQRLATMENNYDYNFENIVCQMVDVFKPANHIQFTLNDFLKRKSDCSMFINMLTDLNKLREFEQRDAYEQRNQKLQNPQWTDWDRFAKMEYRRIVSENEDGGGEILNMENDD